MSAIIGARKIFQRMTTYSKYTVAMTFRVCFTFGLLTVIYNWCAAPVIVLLPPMQHTAVVCAMPGPPSSAMSFGCPACRAMNVHDVTGLPTVQGTLHSRRPSALPVWGLLYNLGLAVQKVPAGRHCCMSV